MSLRKIEFYHVDAMEAPNYEPIWVALRRLGIDATLVAPPPERNRAGTWFDYERLCEYYRQRRVPFATTMAPEAVGITTQNADILGEYRCPHIRLMYGPRIYPQAWGLSEKATQPFDLILVHGPHYLDVFSRWQPRENLLVVGYPKYDAFFGGLLDTDRIRKRWQCNTSRPTVLYLPTWDANSSFDQFIGAVGELATEYNLIIKPHHCTIRMEPERMKVLLATTEKYSLSAYDLPELLAIADVVLCDARSGTLCESLMTERRTICLCNSANELDRWVRSSGLDTLCTVCTEPQQLREAVLRSLDRDKFVEARRIWGERHVAYRDGTAATVAATKLAERLALDSGSTRIFMPRAVFDQPGQSDGIPETLPCRSRNIIWLLPDGLRPEVTIVLPTYNHLRFLPVAIESILQQTWRDFELIIVNDGSTDGTREYLDLLDDPRIRVIHQENSRLPSALNTGFRLANGKLFTWISSDNYCSPIFLETLVEAFSTNPKAGFAYSAFAWINENDQITGIHQNQDVSWNNMIKANPGIASFMYPRECHETLGWYDPDLEGAEDWDMWLRIIEKYPAVYVPEITCYYRLHNDSMTATMKSKVALSSQKTIIKALERQNIKSPFNLINLEMNPVLVSVIIPTYNRPDMLVGAVKSVLAQTFTNFEIIVINDCGIDVSEIFTVIDDKRITYINHEVNKGLAATRNTGIRAARGKYIAYLDDDDIYYPDHLETLVSWLENNPEYKVAYTDAYRAHQEPDGVGGYIVVKKDVPYSFDFDYERILHQNFIPVLCIVHAKECMEVVGMFDESLRSHEDWDLWMRMSQQFRFYHIAKLTSEFRWRTDYTTLTFSDHMQETYRIVKARGQLIKK